ncbi:helix-turn-helix transcriptional regulator [Paenibacillus mesophilus]|uniref:helix-turn-helix transcriptional regulator n=1 Tax=Paenibacillus mesophilus TaxID=2582849 RepID=UPI001EE450F9|nr:AraC family transcriptional regulator [Paenibacillus mesophilus]
MPNLPCILPTLPERRFFCSPVSVGSSWDVPEHSIYRGKGAINEFNIHLVVSGKGYVEIEGKSYMLQAGSAFLYFPLEEQRYYSSEDDPWHVKWVHFYGDKLKEFMIEHGFHRSTLWSMNQVKPLEEAHLALYEEASRHKILHETKLSALTYAFLVEFMGHAVPFSAVKGTASADRIPELLPYMQERAREPFDLEYWAGQAEVSSYYFCKLFRKATRMTPLAFITLCRLQYGKQRLLEQLDLPIQQIAKEAGYSSASYFNKRFMEHEGMTPSEFRELYMRKS